MYFQTSRKFLRTDRFVGILAAFAATFIGFLGASDADAQNASGKKVRTGDEIVRDMCRIYQSAETFQDRSEAKITTLGGSQYIQSNDIRFKKPNMIVIESRDPIQGTFYTYASGTFVTVYSGKQNIFMKRDTPQDLKGTLKRISTTVQDTLNITSEQLLSPISFLSAKNGVPEEGSDFKLVKTEIIDGKEVYRLAGKANQSWFDRFAPRDKSIKIHPGQRDIVLWVDVKTNLLLKSFAALTFYVILPKNGKTPAKRLTDGVTFVETHSNTRINPTFKATDFGFREPRNAQQIFPSTRSSE